jgi:hypothetical protein
MASKIDVSQIDTGNVPGKIPVFDDNGELLLVCDPVDALGAVTKQYADNIIIKVEDIVNQLQQPKTPLITTHTIHIQPVNTQLVVYESNIKITNSTHIEQPTVVAIADVKKHLLKSINDICTAVVAYDVIHREKFEQAVDFIIGNYTDDITNFPLIQLDTELFNITSKEAADNIVTARKQWLLKVTQLEKIRLSTKQTIEPSLDISYINAIYDNFLIEVQKIG